MTKFFKPNWKAINKAIAKDIASRKAVRQEFDELKKTLDVKFNERYRLLQLEESAKHIKSLKELPAGTQLRYTGNGNYFGKICSKVKDGRKRMHVSFDGKCFAPFRADKVWRCSTSDEEQTWSMILSTCAFHNDWNWLMPVVEKIVAQQDFFRVTPLFQSNVNYCSIVKVHPSMETVVKTGGEMSAIESVWLAVVEFIKWYNSTIKVNS